MVMIGWLGPIKPDGYVIKPYSLWYYFSIKWIMVTGGTNNIT